MSTFYIDAVRTEAGPFKVHKHIAKVRLTNGQILTRGEVIANIRFHRNVFYTYRARVVGAKVIVHPCPHCGANDYITTQPDNTTANNLLSLPTF